ncbi:MAG: histidine kinase [Anaerolineaceae bacterium]|nr:MAG: histidine kinase [Anaerolineaceae bacterium]
MSHRILVVDDNALNLDLVGKILGLEGYEVITAESGDEALQKVGAFQPDMAILDVMMPDMDGFELCRRLRRLPECAGIPVIMLTASSSESDKIEAQNAGANDLLGKPFSMDTLRAHIHAFLK